MNARELRKRYQHLVDIELISLNQVRPTILFGLPHAHLGAPLMVREGKTFPEPIAMKTRLGWSIHGPDAHMNEGNVKPVMTHCRCQPNDEDIHELVKYHFTTESLGIKPPGPTLESIEEIRAREMLEKYTVRRDDRFVAPLLWREDNIKMPSSYKMAKWREACRETKLDKNPDLKERYDKKIEQYLSKGYARKLSEEEIMKYEAREWYLPHFPVVNPNKPGKTRPVFDAAAKVGKESLNSYLLRGPDLFVDMIEVLLNFRVGQYAVTGDLEEMFHQIIIREEDQPSQRFLWRGEAYQMVRMTFGAKCSPVTAQFVKNLNADQLAEEFPKAQEPIKKCTFVDDYLDSFFTKQNAIETTCEVFQVHQKGGFNMKDWNSNDRELEMELPGEKSFGTTLEIDMDKELITQKVLGLHWLKYEDTLIFKVNLLEKLKLNPDDNPTKREFLQILMSIYDVFGFLAPFTMIGKSVLQDIWRSKIGWDHKLKTEEQEKFAKWIAQTR